MILEFLLFAIISKCFFLKGLCSNANVVQIHDLLRIPKLINYKHLYSLEIEKLKLPYRENENTLTNLFTFRIDNFTDEKKFHLFNNLGFVYVQKVFPNSNYYLFLHNDTCHRCKRNPNEVLDHVRTHVTWVEWAAQHHLLQRYQRSENNILVSVFDHKRCNKRRNKNSFCRIKQLHFNDPLFRDQWYLENKGQTGTPPENDINVLPVWEVGITGHGVRISVLDDGVNEYITELANNYDPDISGEFFDFQIIKGAKVSEKSHGTSCAAIAAGVANNKFCGVGVAYEAKVGGVKVLDGQVTDYKEAASLIYALERVDIYTASWGPKDDGGHMEGPGHLTRMAFLKGIEEGRQGKGAIYVWAAGNGGGKFDNCNLDGYASSPYTLTFGALTAEGFSTYYSEPCAAVIASTYVGGLHEPPAKKLTPKEKRRIKVVVPEGNWKCRETFQGTSAAAPMAAGIVALVLQANPSLTWRDVQHLIVETSRIPASGEEGWSINGAGKHFHLKIGFGVLDSQKLVEAAIKWKPVKPMHVWASPLFNEIRSINKNCATVVQHNIKKDDMDLEKRIDKIETVIARINIMHPNCGDLEIFLESPSGTRSQILTRRPLDNQTTEIPHWDFLSLHFWGEDPKGLWKLHICNLSEYTSGVLNYFLLIFFGTYK